MPRQPDTRSPSTPLQIGRTVGSQRSFSAPEQTEFVIPHRPTMHDGFTRGGGALPRILPVRISNAPYAPSPDHLGIVRCPPFAANQRIYNRKTPPAFSPANQRLPTSDGSRSRGTSYKRPEAFIVSFPLQAFLQAMYQSMKRVSPTVMKLLGNCGHTRLNVRLERVPRRKYASKRYPGRIHSWMAHKSRPQQPATSEASPPCESRTIFIPGTYSCP